MKWFLEDCEEPSEPAYTFDDVVSCSREVFSEYPFVTKALLFGSFARGEQTATSDVDLIVWIEGPHDHGRLTDLECSLAAALGRDVDVLTHLGRTSQRFIDNILREGKLIYIKDRKVVTDEMIADWESALERDEWPNGWVNVGEIVERNLVKKVEDYRAGRLETVTLDELEENLELTGVGKEADMQWGGF